jgi:hypothetical protein
MDQWEESSHGPTGNMSRRSNTIQIYICSEPLAPRSGQGLRAPQCSQGGKKETYGACHSAPLEKYWSKPEAQLKIYTHIYLPLIWDCSKSLAPLSQWGLRDVPAMQVRLENTRKTWPTLWQCFLLTQDPCIPGSEIWSSEILCWNSRIYTSS